MREKRVIHTGPSEWGASRYALASRCLRRYRFREDAEKAGRIEAPSSALIEGTLMHVALAHHYALMNDASANEIHQPLDAVETTITENGWSRDHFPVVQAAYEAYQAAYPSETWRVLAVEQEQRVSFKGLDGEPVSYTARVDLVIEDLGRIFFVDHKTCFAIRGTTLTQHVLDLQMIGYQAIGRRHYGTERFGGVILNRIKLVPTQFRRDILEPSPGAVGRFRQHVAHWNQQIRTWERRPAWEAPAAFNAQTCMDRYGRCPYFDRCQWGENGGAA